MNTTLKNVIKAKAEARQDWQSATMEKKLQALIQMQKLARNMAKAANRPFTGVVWKEPLATKKNFNHR